jgi:hypothetical protein
MREHDQKHRQRSQALNIGAVRSRRCHPDPASSEPLTGDQPKDQADPARIVPGS